MHDVTLSKVHLDHFILARELHVGEMGVVTEPGHAHYGHVILRTYDCVVSLNTPTATWEKNCSLKVRRLHAGETVTLRVK